MVIDIVFITGVSNVFGLIYVYCYVQKYRYVSVITMGCIVDNYLCWSESSGLLTFSRSYRPVMNAVVNIYAILPFLL